MRKKFCPKCGKETEKLFENLCKDCFLEKIKIAEKLPEKIILRKCKSCEKFYFENKQANSLEESIDQILMKILEKKEIQSATYRIAGDKVFVNLEIIIDDLKKSEEKIFPLVIKNITCKFCSLKKSNYFEAVIQLRAPKELENEIMEEIENKISNLNKYDNFAFISRVDKLKEGVDLQVGSKSVASQIAKFLKNKYHAKVKVTHKFFGLKEGKKTYRDTILVSIE